MRSLYEFKQQDVYDFAHFMNTRIKVGNGNANFEICPYCKSRKDKYTFGISLETGQFKCQRASCGASGNMLTLSRDFDFSLGNIVDEYYRPKRVYRQFKKFENPIEPKPEAIKYLESRGISQEVAEKYEITVQTKNPNVLVFPFYDENGDMVFVKYRKTDFDKEKDKNKEWAQTGGKPILFGMKQCNDKFDRLVITEGQCFDGEAEIFTEHGWTELKNYAGENVLQVHEDMTADFVRPSQYIIKRHTGKMIQVSIGGNYYSSTTDDHNLVFVMNTGKVIKKQAQEKISPAYHIPTAIYFNSNGLRWNKDMIALFLATSADGTIDYRKNTGCNKPKADRYIRFAFAKKRKANRLEEILTRLNIHHSHTIDDRGYDSICFPCPCWLRTKYLPVEFVTKTTISQKKFIIEEMVHWDGNHVKGRKQYEYTTTIKHNADIIQAVASTCGYMSTIMQKSNGGNGNFRKSFVYKISILLNKKYVATQQFEKHKKIVNVDKLVYCVTVPTGMILVRQQNKVSVSGNCDSLAVATAGVENAVSVPNGAKGFTWVPYCWNWLNQWKEVVIFGDYERGEMTLLPELSKRLKTSIKHVRYEDYKDCKDANDILRKYGKEQVRKCVENAVMLPIKQVIQLADVQTVDIYKIEKLPTGIKQIDRLLRGGIPFGGVTLISGKTSEGKSTLASQIMISAIEHGYKCFAYSGELANYQFQSCMNFQVAGSRHIIEVQNQYGDLEYGISNTNMALIKEWYRNKIWLYDNTAVVDRDEQKSLVELAESIIMQYGVKVILLDNLMTAIDLEEVKGSDKYERQGMFVKELARLAQRYNVVILLVAHKRKNNFSNNENDEIMGSSDISNLAMVTIAYERGDIRNGINEDQRICKISKNRLFGNVNTKGWILDYDEKSKRIYGFGDDVNIEYGWNPNENGFISITNEDDLPFHLMSEAEVKQ